MPWAPKRACSVPGCPGLATLHGRCEAHARQQGIRPGPWGAPSSAARKRLRGEAWMRLRRQVLSEERDCRLCGAPGIPTDIVDHIRALAEGGGDDRMNLQRICRSCSASKTARESARARWR